MDQVLKVAGEYWLAYLFAATVIYISHQWVNRLQERRDLLVAARKYTLAFYNDVDRLLASDKVQPDTKALLYDMLVIITDEKLGAKVFRSFMDAIETETQPATDRAQRELSRIRKDQPEIEAEITAVLRKGLAAFVLGNCHGDRRVNIAIADTNDMPLKFAELIDQFMKRFSAGSGNGDSGRMRTA